MGEKGLASGIPFIGMGNETLEGCRIHVWWTVGRPRTVDVIIVHAEAMKQVSRVSWQHRDRLPAK